MIRIEPNVETFESVDKEFQTIRNIVKNLLENEPDTRDSDKRLIFRVLQETINLETDWKRFSQAPNLESIRRCRQLLQAENQDLRADDYIEELRNKRRDELRLLMTKPRGIEVF